MKPTHETRDNRLARLRHEAEARLEARSKRTAKEQLAIIASRPGESKREKTRIMAALSPTKAKQVTKQLAIS